MEIYVMRNGERLGPFSTEDVQAQIAKGDFSPSDYAWTAGFDDWKPLSEILSTPVRSKITSPAPETGGNVHSPKASPGWLLGRRISIIGSALTLLIIAGAIGYVLKVSPKKHLGTSDEESSASMNLRALAKTARHSVLLIEVYDEGGKAVATGSGFFVSNDGLLVTNYHVIEKASSAVAKADNGELFPITGALQFDRDNDLVLLAVEGRELAFLPLGNTDRVEPGDHIAVIGSPLGLEGSVSEGIVSAKRAQSSGEHGWLQITAPISPGSSGSPVLDTSGNVIGVATMMLRGGQSLNFAVPVEAAMSMLRIAQEGDRGRARQPFVPLAALSKRDTQNAAAAQAKADLAAMESPELKAAEKAMSDALLAVVLHKSADWENALNCAKALVAKYPDFGFGYSRLGDVYKDMGSSEEAIEAYQQAIKADPDEADAWASLGSIFKEQGKITQADFAFSQAIGRQIKRASRRTAGADFSLKALGDIYRAAGNNDGAKQSYLQAIQESPTNPMPLHALADIYLREGDEKDAFAAACRIMLLNPRHKIPAAEAWDYLAGLYYQLNRDEDGYRCEVNARDLGLKR